MAIKTLVGGGFDGEHPHTSPWWHNSRPEQQTFQDVSWTTATKNVSAPWAENRHDLDRYHTGTVKNQRFY